MDAKLTVEDRPGPTFAAGNYDLTYAPFVRRRLRRYNPLLRLQTPTGKVRHQGVLEESFVQINISTRHGHLSEATREKITAKLEKLSRLFERLTAIELTVDVEHEDDPHVELKVAAEHKHDFVATDRGGTLMASLDNCIHKLEQQLRKYKEKVLDRHRVPSKGPGEGATAADSE